MDLKALKLELIERIALLKDGPRLLDRPPSRAFGTNAHQHAA